MKDLLLGLSKEDKNVVESHFVSLKFGKKDFIYSAWDKRWLFIEEKSEWKNNIWLYLIKSWVIKISIQNWDKENTIAFLKEWDFFWEVSTIMNFKPTAKVLALSDTEIQFIHAPVFNKLLLEIPQLAVNLAKYMARRIQHQSAIIFDHVFRCLESRVASNILNLNEEFWEKDNWRYLIPLKITHQDLADFVWTNRETITKILTKFRKEWVVSFDERKFVIEDIEWLKDIMRDWLSDKK